MVDILSCFTEPAQGALKWIGQQILNPFTFLWCFSTNIKNLRDEVQMLDNATKGLQLQVDNARNEGNIIIDPEVQAWLEYSNDIKDKTSEILSEATNVESDHLKLGERLSLSKRAKEMTDRAKELRERKKFDVIFHPGPPAARQAVLLGQTFEFESRKEIEEEIMTALRGGEVNKIGIWGMGGLGKTTMAEKIMKRVLTHVFEEVVYVTVGKDLNISKIQDDIGRQLRLEKLKEETSQTVREKELQSRLSNPKRTLLVLDDVWDALVLMDFGIPPDSKRCTILFTTRNLDALQRMYVGKIFAMKVLPEEEAWSFFKERARPCVDNMELNLAKQVAKECGGLPINLAAVAAMLKDKGEAAIWNHRLDQLKISVPENVQYDANYKPLKLSYEYLDSKEAQFVFLLCCLFPEDADIPLDHLTYFSMGLGGVFEEYITNIEQARNSMCDKIDFLKDRSLILESDKKGSVRMHDVVRDVCIFIAKEKKYIGKDGCTWISSHLVRERNQFLSGSKYPDLRLLLLHSRDDDSLGFKFDNAFVEGMRQLNVLCIERCSLTTLPRPTQSLGKIHTLILESCKELMSISIVGEMVNLEILICRGCYSIEELPSEMKGLKSLKVLDLTGCMMSIGRGIVSSLIGLEELKMSGNFIRWEAEDRDEIENASLTELEALTNLACLEIDIYDPSLLAQNMPLISSKKIGRFKIRYAYEPEDFQSELCKAMRLHLERETPLGDWIEKQFLRDTEYLYLSGDGANNVDLAITQNIRWLELYSCGSMKNVDATVFPSIEHLELKYLPELQEICDGPISSTSFQYLKELELKHLRALTQIWKSSSVCQSNYVPNFSKLSSIEITHCDGLRDLGQLSMAAGKDCLPHLEELKISWCSMMEKVFLWNDSLEKRQVIKKEFPKLKQVELDYLPNLTTFCQGIEGIDFPLLMEMKIRKCPKMKSIMGSSSADIDGNASLHLFCQPQKVFFGSLEKLMIDAFGSTSIFTLSMAANLVNLRELSIENCEEMIKVIEDEQQQQRIRLVIPKLEKLTLFSLPKLVSFCDSECAVQLPLLRNVLIRRCPSMRNFSLGLVDTPKLKDFTTDLSTYVGVGVEVAFNCMKELKTLVILGNKNPLNDKISVSLFNGLEKLEFLYYSCTTSLFSSSAVRQLVNLRVLRINLHNDFELVNVIKDREAEEEEDGKVVSGGEIITSVVIFPKLEELYLDHLRKLVRFCEWTCEVQLPFLRKLVISQCDDIENFSKGIVTAPNLKILQIDGDICATKDLNGALHQHHKEKLLYDSKILEIHHNPFHEIRSSAFYGLEELTISEYEGSMSLFTLSVAAKLVNLSKLSLQHCSEMIKVIEDEQPQERILVFPRLNQLYLKELPKLVTFCDSKCEVELPNLLLEVVIEKCPNMKNLSLGLVAIPNVAYFTTDLSTYAGIGVDVTFNSPRKLIISENENPFDSQKISVSLLNGLQELEFERRGSMSIFTLSMAANLVSFVNLRKIHIVNCDEIVKVIEDEEENVVSGKIRNSVVFPKLEGIYLRELPKLVSFCEWKGDFEFPSLTKVEIWGCPNMESFSMGSVDAPNLKIVEIDQEEIDATEDLNAALRQHCLAHKKEIFRNKILRIKHNPFYGHEIPSPAFNRLEKLTISEYKGSMSLFTLSMAANLVSLTQLSIENCDEMIRVIEDEQQQVASGGVRIVVFPKLEKLYLKNLPKLVTTCHSRCDIECPTWEVEIKRCPNMESFSLGSVATPKVVVLTTDLTTHVGVGVDVAFNSPMKLEIRENENPFDHHKISVSLFNGLVTLILYDFKGSVSLFSSSAIGNLVNLQRLGIGKCDETIKIMEDEEENVVSGGEVRNVVFPNLEELYLKLLPKLVRFSEWKCDVQFPSLTKVRIEKCPNMENFSMGSVAAPNLKFVKIDHQETGGIKDLNGLLQQHYVARQEKGNEEEEERSKEKNGIEEEDDD